jgi:hypothetical protein
MYYRYLSLSYNNISTISNGSFKALGRLRTLFIDHNYQMTPVTLDPVFRVATLVCVDMSHGKMTAFPDSLFEPGAVPKLQFLYVGFHYVKVRRHFSHCWGSMQKSRLTE